MEFTKYFSEVNKLQGAFPALLGEHYATMMNLVALETRKACLRDVRKMDLPADIARELLAEEVRINEAINKLRGGKNPQQLLQSWIVRRP